MGVQSTQSFINGFSHFSRTGSDDDSHHVPLSVCLFVCLPGCSCAWSDFFVCFYKFQFTTDLNASGEKVGRLSPFVPETPTFLFHRIDSLCAPVDTHSLPVSPPHFLFAEENLENVAAFPRLGGVLLRCVQ